MVVDLRATAARDPAMPSWMEIVPDPNLTLKESRKPALRHWRLWLWQCWLGFPRGRASIVTDTIHPLELFSYTYALS